MLIVFITRQSCLSLSLSKLYLGCAEFCKMDKIYIFHAMTHLMIQTCFIFYPENDTIKIMWGAHVIPKSLFHFCCLYFKVRYTYAPYEDHRCISVRKINLHDVHMCIKVNLPFLYSNAILTDFRVSSFSCLILLFYTTGWITTQTFT